MRSKHSADSAEDYAVPYCPMADHMIATYQKNYI